MKKIAILAFVPLIFLAFSFGCVDSQAGNETKLEVTQGMGIVGSLSAEELYPGLDGFVSLTVRNNLGGETGRDVYVSLDNVAPFKIYECGDLREPTQKRSDFDCSGDFGLDEDLTFRQHGVQRFLPGEEIEFYWRITAPSADKISNIALKHPMYYDVEYNYWTNFHENVVFMSFDEKRRRAQSETEEVTLSGEAGMGAGELRLSSQTKQPISFQFAYKDDMTAQEPDYNFALNYNLENQGNGYPLSDVVLVLSYPDEVEVREGTTSTYGWYSLEGWNQLNPDDKNCRTGKLNDEGRAQTMNCIDWAKSVIGEDNDIWDEENLIIKKIERDNFQEINTVYAPLVLSGDEMTELKQTNTPLKIYTFNLHSTYRYFTEGKDYIMVYPIKG